MALVSGSVGNRGKTSGPTYSHHAHARRVLGTARVAVHLLGVWSTPRHARRRYFSLDSARYVAADLAQR